MRIYVSGPITGIAGLNKAAFADATARLQEAGHTVLNPHLVCTILDQHECLGPCTPSEDLLPWADYLRADLVSMLQHCNAVALLPGWDKSRGAQLERHVATALGWEVRTLQDWLYPVHTVNKENRSA